VRRKPEESGGSSCCLRRAPELGQRHIDTRWRSRTPSGSRVWSGRCCGRGGFDTNAFAWAETVRAQRTVSAPFGDIGLPGIDPADIAEVAAVVLRDVTHAWRTYELTGPEATSPRERAVAIGDALGTPVRFAEQTRDQARAQMLRFMPEVVVDGTLAILGEPLPAEQQVSPDVEKILGRAPRSFAAWAADNVGAFR
jgi:uncharacterized protein YbjT (DUF2867 family)